MEISTRFKKLMVDHPGIVRRAVLTYKQIEYFKFAQGRQETRTYDLADRFDLSLQHASLELSRLYNAGYMKRVKEVSPTGGHIYVYTTLF